MDFSRKEAERQEVIDRLANSLRSAGAQVDDFELKRLVSLLPEEVWKAP
jgi:menaquinone-dependent protoporphyrinogen IX oxidase